MALPAKLTSTVFNDGDLVTSALWYSRVFSYINAIRDALNPMTSLWAAVDTAGGTNIPNVTFTKLPMDTIRADTDGIGLAGFPAGGYVVPVTGVYLVSGCAAFNTNSTSGARRIVCLDVNGTAPAGSGTRTAIAPMGANGVVPTGQTLLNLNAGDVVSLSAWQDTGSPITNVGQSVTALTVRRLS